MKTVQKFWSFVEAEVWESKVHTPTHAHNYVFKVRLRRVPIHCIFLGGIHTRYDTLESIAMQPVHRGRVLENPLAENSRWVVPALLPTTTRTELNHGILLPRPTGILRLWLPKQRVRTQNHTKSSLLDRTEQQVHLFVLCTLLSPHREPLADQGETLLFASQQSRAFVFRRIACAVVDKPVIGVVELSGGPVNGATATTTTSIGLLGPHLLVNNIVVVVVGTAAAVVFEVSVVK